MTVASTFTPFQQMCSSAMIQGITVNGVPLHSVGRIEQVWEDVMGMPSLYGDSIHAPLRPGALHIPQIPGAREFGIGMLVYGRHDKDQAGHNNNWRIIAQALWSPRVPLNIRRTLRYSVVSTHIDPGTGLPVPDIDPGTGLPIEIPVDETHECQAKLIGGLTPTMIVGGAMSRLALRLLNLDGYWYGITENVYTITSATTLPINIPGDAETNRMTISISGGTGLQTLANTTTGCLLTYNQPTTAHPVNLDVLPFEAIQDGSSVLGNVTHSGDVFWMRLRPGNNQLSITGGATATLSVRSAYL